MIRISFSRDDGNHLFTVADNGRGLPSGFNALAAKSFGLELVNFLARHQLQAEIEIRTDKVRRLFSIIESRGLLLTWESILVVEDDGLIAFCLSELLEKAGYRIIGLTSTIEMVLRKLEIPKKPDLILMDVGLSGSLDGIETARRVQQRFSVPPYHSHRLSRWQHARTDAGGRARRVYRKTIPG